MCCGIVENLAMPVGEKKKLVGLLHHGALMVFCE